MLQRSVFFPLLIVGILAGANQSLWAQAPPVLRDLRGDPLPAGAYLRLGSRSQAIDARQNDIRTIQFSRDGRTIASSSTSSIEIWDAATGQVIKQLKGHTDFVNSLTFCPDGKTLASGSFDQTLRLWDLATGKEVHQLKGAEKGIAYIAVSPNGKMLASGGYDKTIRLWDVAAGKEIRQLAGSQVEILFLAFSPDNKTLASGGIESTIRL